MVILGWADLYKTTNDKRYLDAAVKASDWLCSISDNDGNGPGIPITAYLMHIIQGWHGLFLYG